MISVIDVSTKPRTRVPEGRVQSILVPSDDATRVHVALVEIDAGRMVRFASTERTQVAYILEGTDARITHTRREEAHEYSAGRRAGVYLEPLEEATVLASDAQLSVLLVTVPKHTGKPIAGEPPAGYVFAEADLRSLVDEKRFRERTFWVNKETGLSGSWDLQLGRMCYSPFAHSPRHVHRPSATSPVVPEHFYLIEKGTGEVKHDEGSLPIGPGCLVFIPAGEWHQLIASDTGLDYVEFQAPFDFVTVMDDDPLGKNWYIKGTDDGTGKPRLWVQS